LNKTLIFANGEPNDGAMVQRALRDGADAHIIAADGGARVANFFGRTPHTIIGDMDSLPSSELQRLTQLGAEVHRYPPEKNETDLELCLQFAADQGASWIRVIGGIGGRFDQVLANVLLMTMPVLAHCDVEVVAGKQAIRLLHAGENALVGEVDDTISLIPLAGDVTGITTQNLRYPLVGETLRFGLARGVSNEMSHTQATVSIQSGVLLLVHTVGKAE
jgi:thiamine pyrophosphokinase